MKFNNNSALELYLRVASVAALSFLGAGQVSRAQARVNNCEVHSPYSQGVNVERVVRLTRPGQEKAEFAIGWSDETPDEVLGSARPVMGGNLEVVRCVSEGRWVVVGEGQVVRADHGYVEALVSSARGAWEGDLSNSEVTERSVEGNMFLRPMTGDRIVPKKVEVSQRLSLSPIVRFSASELFVGGELSTDGRQKILDLKERFASSNGRLLIEVESRALGNRVEIRRESQLKANLVAQSIAVLWNLAPNRVVAIGKGADGNNFKKRILPVWPDQDSEETIVVRALPENHRAELQNLVK